MSDPNPQHRSWERHWDSSDSSDDSYESRSGSRDWDSSDSSRSGHHDSSSSDESGSHGSHEGYHGHQHGSGSHEDGHHGGGALVVIAALIVITVVIVLIVFCCKRKNKRAMSVASLKPVVVTGDAPALPKKTLPDFHVITITPQSAPAAPAVGAPPPVYQSTPDLRTEDPRAEIPVSSPPPAYD